MILDIFSSFDPFNINIPQFILFPSLITYFCIFIYSFWTTPSFMLSNLSSISFIIFPQRKSSLGNNLKPFTLIISSLFLMLIIINLTGLVPYIFAIRRHLTITFSLRIPIWLSLISRRVINNPLNSISILLPRGAPEWLNPFLILIETIRISIRPITLAFRLAANITAGHVVLGLIGSYLSSSLFSSFSSSSLVILTESFYIIFELGICLIQAYIFCLLLTLYSNDHS